MPREKSAAPREVPDGEESEPSLYPLEITAKAWTIAAWREALAFVGHLSGADLPPGECFELMLAPKLSHL